MLRLPTAFEAFEVFEKEIELPKDFPAEIRTFAQVFFIGGMLSANEQTQMLAKIAKDMDRDKTNAMWREHIMLVHAAMVEVCIKAFKTGESTKAH